MKGTTFEVKGLAEVLQKIKDKRLGAGKGVEIGIARATGLLFADSQFLVPVEYQALKDSGYMRVTGRLFKTKGTVGYTAPYAMAVHEKVEMVLAGQPRPSGIGVYWGPHGQAKFLEGPIRRNNKAIKVIIREAVKEYLYKA